MKLIKQLYYKLRIEDLQSAQELFRRGEHAWFNHHHHMAFNDSYRARERKIRHFYKRLHALQDNMIQEIQYKSKWS